MNRSYKGNFFSSMTPNPSLHELPPPITFSVGDLCSKIRKNKKAFKQLLRILRELDDLP